MNGGKYTLKAMLTTEENIEICSGFRFTRIPSDYILLYTDEEVKGATELPPEGFALLTDADKAWLIDCVTLVAIENGMKDQKAVKQNTDEFMRNFEKELQAEYEKLNGKAVAADGEH